MQIKRISTGIVSFSTRFEDNSKMTYCSRLFYLHADHVEYVVITRRHLRAGIRPCFVSITRLHCGLTFRKSRVLLFWNFLEENNQYILIASTHASSAPYSRG